MKVKVQWFLSKLLNLISIGIIVLSIFILLTVIMTKNNESPSFMGYSFFRVLTGSMEPTIPTDSFILVKKVDSEQIEKGDIISFYATDSSFESAVVTHRVKEIIKEEENYYFITQGDANNVVDSSYVYKENVVGVVVGHSLWVGKIVKLMANPLFFFPCILGPLFVLVVSNLFTTIKTTKELMKEEEEAAIRALKEDLENKKKRR